MSVHLDNLRDKSLVYGCALLGNIDDSNRIRIGSQWAWQTFIRRMKHIPHAASFHNAKLFQEYGVFDESFKIAGDYEFLLRCGKNLKVVFIDKIIVCLGDNGMSSLLRTTSIIEAKRAQLIKVAHRWKIYLWYFATGSD